MIKGTVIVILLTLIVSSQQCHYSCSTCIDQFYSSCTKCAKDSPLLKQQASSQFGVCSDLSMETVNIGGVLLLMSIIISCSIFLNEEIVHFTLLIQSLSLLFLVEVLWASHTHYILSSFTYLMVLTRIEYAYNHTDGQVHLFKSQLFFKNTDITDSTSLVLSLNGLLTVIIIAIPVFNIIRKKVNQERPNCLSQVTLDKVLTFANFIYLLLIQETLLTFYFCFSFGRVAISAVVLVILYFLSLVFFVVNQWYSQLSIFRTRLTFLNIILLKILTPLFITLDRNQHYLLLILFIVFYGIDAILTNKNRNSNSINRLLYYKIYSLVVFILLLVNYFVESNNNQASSKPMGVISTLLLCGIVYFFIMETVIQFRNAYYLKQGERQDLVQITLQQIVNEQKQQQKQTIHLDFNSIVVDQQQPHFINTIPNKGLTQSNIKQSNETVEGHHPELQQESPKQTSSKMSQKNKGIKEIQIQIRPCKDNHTEPQLVNCQFVASELAETESKQEKIVSKQKGRKRKHRE